MYYPRCKQLVQKQKLWAYFRAISPFKYEAKKHSKVNRRWWSNRDFIYEELAAIRTMKTGWSIESDYYARNVRYYFFIIFVRSHQNAFECFVRASELETTWAEDSYYFLFMSRRCVTENTLTFKLFKWEIKSEFLKSQYFLRNAIYANKTKKKLRFW